MQKVLFFCTQNPHFWVIYGKKQHHLSEWASLKNERVM